MSDDNDDFLDQVELRLNRRGEALLAKLLGVPVEELERGHEIPGVGRYHGISYERGFGFWIWFNDEYNSTGIYPMRELRLTLGRAEFEGGALARRAVTRGSARIVDGSLEVESSAEVEGLMVASSESTAHQNEQSVTSRSTARPAGEPDDREGSTPEDSSGDT